MGFARARPAVDPASIGFPLLSGLLALMVYLQETGFPKGPFC